MGSVISAIYGDIAAVVSAIAKVIMFFHVLTLVLIEVVLTADLNLGGGLSGAAGKFVMVQFIGPCHNSDVLAAMVLALIPLRTIMNYQYRYGVTMTQAIKVLYADGGWTRYYQGLTAALVLGPVSRFGETAANAGIIAFFESNNTAVLTIMQIQGEELCHLLHVAQCFRYCRYNIYRSLPNKYSTLRFIPSSPILLQWNSCVPQSSDMQHRLFLTPFQILFAKSHHRVNGARIGYIEAVYAVIEADGIKGLFGRGLKTRILVNGLQGTMFSMLWKLFSDMWNEKIN
ncbi:hypothetical protein AZE42_06578 [Rhizopogon vesiculosus]|uniref:Mitochondrial carrier protein n=1 Tax=Rhizopogon vesiculosus TaxID=180088 RepID=A0A1J8R3I4_9AGAM|nr:hypothetical protein AZE42_06578 [Rhizopogon vesiculosus]